MTTAGYLRFPHINGDLLVFAADDDIWLAPAAGGRAWRVSSDHAPVSHPRLSRDGSLLAWTSGRDGAPEVWVAEVDGGRARRLSYWGDESTRVTGWSPDGDVLAVTAAGQPFSRFTWAHAVPVTGGAPRREPFGPVADLAVEPGGVTLLGGTWGRDPAYWKRYRGGTGGRLWARAAGQEAFSQVLTGLRAQFASPMLVEGRLVFLADHEGTGNLYSCRLDGGDLRRHTDHDGFYARCAGTDGRRVVYQCAGEIWLLDSLAAAPRRLAIDLGPSAPVPPPRLISAADHLDDLSCDQTARASAIEVAGTVHWLTHTEGPARALSVSPTARARLPRVLGAEAQVVWVTDEGGQDALAVAPVGGDAPLAEPRRLASGQIGMAHALAAAPDGSTVAVASRDGRLHVVDVATGNARVLAQSDDGPVGGLAYSPDSAWLAWSQPGPRPLSRIRLARLADSGVTDVTDVTDGRFCDFDPAFTGDGKYLAFLSRRSFDPVYDAHSFDMSFPNGCRPYLVALAAATPSPFAPLPEGRPVREDHHAHGGDGSGDDDGPGDAEEAGGGAKGAPRVQVDADGLPGRLVPVPVAESRYSCLRAVTGGLAWLRSHLAGVLGEGGGDPDDDPPRPSLERFDLAQRSCGEIVGELDWFEVSGDGDKLVIADRGGLRVVPSHRRDDGDGAEPVQVDLSRARFLADPAARRGHAFDEAGRVMRHDFWVPDMAEVDWDGVLAAYRPLLERIRTQDDFVDLLWEIFGELGVSHAYVRPSPREDDPGPGLGYLGADLVRAEDGTWQVARILPGESSDPFARSPLAAPGVMVAPGSALLAVDGQRVDPAAGPGPLLAGAASKPVELAVAAPQHPAPQHPAPQHPAPQHPAPQHPAPRDAARRVAVVPLASERRLRYQDWVAAKRSAVRERSGGRAGYLHVPDMMGEGWAHFHRDLRSEMARDLLILDLRYNRGGHVSELVVERLARRIIGWDVARGLRPESYPHDAPRGPVVAVTNEFAGSDGDVITAAIRILGLGPVVGTRTWGGVIGIGDAYQLVDGTAITIPRYALYLGRYGWGVENYGVDPDVETVITPEDWAAGRDTQLDTAVRLGLAALQTHPPARPPGTADRPSRRRPQLPPRAGGDQSGD